MSINHRKYHGLMWGLEVQKNKKRIVNRIQSGGNWPKKKDIKGVKTSCFALESLSDRERGPEQLH